MITGRYAGCDPADVCETCDGREEIEDLERGGTVPCPACCPALYNEATEGAEDD